MSKQQRTRKPKTRTTYQFAVLGQQVQLDQIQTAMLGVFACLVIYLAVRQPPIAAIVISGVLTVAGTLLLPTVAKAALRDKQLQWATATVAMLLVVAGTKPASAQFFNALEQATQEVVTASNSGIDAAVVTGIFILVRVLVVLAFVAGAVGLLVQMFRGGDWQPMLTLIGIGMAFVIGVEIISNLMLGGAGAGAGGGAGGGGAGGGGFFGANPGAVKDYASTVIPAIAAKFGVTVG
ncbi:hypothetical protein [Leptolyngbya ohadii]|uniref:hypothetical protein n=1 Tax=Leptolyngbya ohadii TaxID=1962290 RepID=UPI001179B18A|nr:hypothetical protein [Leptolyngbya ohadii]